MPVISYWPDGALGTCLRLGDAHPEWWVTWWSGHDSDLPAPVGFWGMHRNRLEHRSAFGETEDELEREIERADQLAAQEIGLPSPSP